MVALKLPTQREKSAGSLVRPINTRRDIPQIVSLLELVFRQHLRGSGRQAVAPMTNYWPLPWERQQPVTGYVHEEDGRIVGNVSLMHLPRSDRLLVANVAVHPDFRRRGIARGMMQAVLQYRRAQKIPKIVLQVEEKNQSAIDLYSSLGFSAIGTVHLWQLSYYDLRPLPVKAPVTYRQPDRFEGFLLRPLRSSDWRNAYQLEIETFPLDMNWPEPPSKTVFRPGLSNWFNNFLAGRQQEIWVAENDAGKLVGMGTIQNEWARPHTLKLRIHPEWLSTVSRPLLAKLLRRIKQMRRHPIHIEHRQDDAPVTQLLQEANFKQRRTLTTMCHMVIL